MGVCRTDAEIVRGEYEWAPPGRERLGRHTERGIKELDGFGAERWRVEPEFAVRAVELGKLGVDFTPLAGRPER
jgi:hypothetical protein